MLLCLVAHHGSRLRRLNDGHEAGSASGASPVRKTEPLLAHARVGRVPLRTDSRLQAAHIAQVVIDRSHLQYLVELFLVGATASEHRRQQILVRPLLLSRSCLGT